MFGRSFFYYHGPKELQGHVKRKRREFFNFLRFSTQSRGRTGTGFPTGV